MNSPDISEQKPQPSRFSRIVRVFIGMIAIIWAVHLWYREEPPLWTSAPIPGGTNPIGFTAEGHLVTADGDQPYHAWRRSTNLNSPLFLTTWDLVAGKSIDRVVRSTPLFREMIIESDAECEVILTRTSTPGLNNPDRKTQWIAIDRRTGEPRFPPFDIRWQDGPAFSPDGCFVAFSIGDSHRGTVDGHAVYDLKSGERVIEITASKHPEKQSKQHGALEIGSSIFSADSRELLTFESDSRGNWIVFHAIPEGIESGRCLLPNLPVWTGLHFSHWDQERLIMIASHDVPSGHAGIEFHAGIESEYLTFEISHTVNSKLIEIGPNASQIWGEEPMYFTHTQLFQDTRATVSGRFDDDDPGSSIVQWWNRNIAQFHDTLELEVSPRSTIQFFERRVDSTLGTSVSLFGHDGSNFLFRISPDGRWLIDGGERLRVWRTPPHGRWWRIPGIGIITILAWALNRRLRGRSC